MLKYCMCILIKDVAPYGVDGDVFVLLLDSTILLVREYTLRCGL